MDTVQRLFNGVGKSIQQATSSWLESAKRLFTPTDDDYPKTGVQPFDGDISETGKQ